MKLNDARRMWTALGADLRQRVLAGERVKVAPRPSLKKGVGAMLKPVHESSEPHIFHAVRTESFVGGIVTVFCDGEVVHVFRL